MSILKSHSLITDSDHIQKMSGYSVPTVNKLLTLNRGPNHANMKTHGLYAIVSNNEIYQFHSDKLSLCFSQPASFRNLEQEASYPHQISIPPFVEIESTWDSTPSFSGKKNNILGDNGILLFNHSNIVVPCVKASRELLAFYHATLISPGDFVTFADPIYPIWSMTIQESYVDSFLMTEEGGGFYLEYHQDQPHYHHAINGGGYYLLAKWNSDKTKLLMTGFSIPNGHAVYTMKNAIHCDAGLTGDYLVGYTTSEACSTVLFRLRDDNTQLVNITFQEAK